MNLKFEDLNFADNQKSLNFTTTTNKNFMKINNLNLTSSINNYNNPLKNSQIIKDNTNPTNINMKKITGYANIESKKKQG